MDQIAAGIIIALVTGTVSAFGTVQAIKVHIAYLREGVNRAHKRIDQLEHRVP